MDTNVYLCFCIKPLSHSPSSLGFLLSFPFFLPISVICFLSPSLLLSLSVLKWHVENVTVVCPAHLMLFSAVRLRFSSTCAFFLSLSLIGLFVLHFPANFYFCCLSVCCHGDALKILEGKVPFSADERQGTSINRELNDMTMGIKLAQGKKNHTLGFFFLFSGALLLQGFFIIQCL